MKRIVSLALGLIMGCVWSMADNIITRDAEIIECKVTQIEEYVVKYRKSGENFEREIERAKIFKIKYDNGEEERFEAPVTQTANTKTISKDEKSPYTTSEPDWASMPAASRQYQIGDWYSENGVEGIVIWTTPDGRHGRLIHPKIFNDLTKKFRNPKPFFKGPVNIPLGMTDASNGYANMLALRKFMVENPQYAPEMYPVYAILQEIGEGWYLPSVLELQYFYQLRQKEVAYSGEHKKFNGQVVKWHKVLNHVSKSHKGGKHDYCVVLSSTEFYSPGGASVTAEKFFGDPKNPQYTLLKYEDSPLKNPPYLPYVRTMGLPFYAFHLF